MTGLLLALQHPAWWFRARLSAWEFGRLERAGWPDALLKAVSDKPWDYALMLRGGALIHFTGARPGASPAWAHLSEPTFRRGADLCFPGERKLACAAPITFDRGVDVRVADIVWATDAPWGG